MCIVAVASPESGGTVMGCDARHLKPGVPMTCIVGLVRNNGVFMGGDSANTTHDGSHIQTIVHSKVFALDQFLIGYTSSFRMGQLLLYGFKPIEYGHSDVPTDLHEYMVNVFAEEARRVFKDGGFTIFKDGAEEGGCFLVGFHGKLFSIHEDFTVGECVDGYEAIGAGYLPALGSLFSTRKLDSPTERVQMALEAAAHLCPSVRSPFNILSQNPVAPKQTTPLKLHRAK